MRVAATATRVQQNTRPAVNARILDKTEDSVERVCSEGPKAIRARIRQLDREWDVERTLITMASTLSLTGLALGRAKSRKFLAIPTVVLGFLFNHALQGWCPPLPALRRLGFRTAREIEDERHALLDRLAELEARR